MSILTPVKVPVKIYRWDDVGAPVFNKTTDVIAKLFKACLVTGYGAKQGAGWTMPFEVSGIKVFRPEVCAEPDFYLRCSGNTTTQMTAQVYINMTDASTGVLKLQCSDPFKFARGIISGKWILIASSRAFWFFCEQAEVASTPQQTTGSYFFAGDVYSQNNTNVYMQHTAGDNYAAYSSLLRTYLYNNTPSTDKTVYSPGKLLQSDNSVITVDVTSITNWDGTNKALNKFVLATLVVNSANDMFVLPGIFTSADGVTKQNFDEVSIASSVALTSTIVFGTGSTMPSNFYISTDYWVR